MAYDFDFSSIDRGAAEAMLEGLVVSFQITATAVLVGVLLGTILALMRLSRLTPVRWFATLYVTLFRSLPLVIVLLWFFLVIPQLLQVTFQIQASTDLRLMSALVAFSLFEAAYFAEIVRAGLQSVGKGQSAAAAALGLSRLDSYRHIILPQAFRNMTPMFLTQGIVLFQDTSLVYVSALADFFGSAATIGERDGRTVELLLFAGAVYFVLCFSASLGTRMLLARGAKR